MDSTKVNGIVIFAKDYKDKDKLVTLFTLEYGIITAVLKGVKSPTAKLKIAKEPFCFGEFILQGQNDIKVISGVSVVDNFFELTENYDRFIIGCDILKIVNRVLRPGQTDEFLFVALLKALRALAYEDVNEKIVYITYLLKVLKSEGYELSLDKCNSCGSSFSYKRFLDFDSCEVVCPSCKGFHSIEIEPAVHNICRILSKTDFENINTIKISTIDIDKILLLLNLIFENRFDYKII